MSWIGFCSSCITVVVQVNGNAQESQSVVWTSPRFVMGTVIVQMVLMKVKVVTLMNVNTKEASVPMNANRPHWWVFTYLLSLSQRWSFQWLQFHAKTAVNNNKKCVFSQQYSARYDQWNLFPCCQGAICTCPPGEVLRNDSRECEDLNECEPPGHCSQQCTNTKGSYYCSCVPGYTLELDKHTCKAISKMNHFNVYF